MVEGVGLGGCRLGRLGEKVGGSVSLFGRDTRILGQASDSSSEQEKQRERTGRNAEVGGRLGRRG